MIAGSFCWAPAQATGPAAGYAAGLVADKPEKVSAVPPAPAYRDVLPRKVDLGAYLPPVGNQGPQGSCAAWATAYGAMSLAYNEALHRNDRASSALPVVAFSPAYTYNLIHRGTCDGTGLIDALDTIRDHGLLPLTEFPYHPDNCARLPDGAQREEASRSRLIHYRKIDGSRGDALDRIRGALYQRHPVVFGLYVGGAEGPFQRYAGGTYATTADATLAHAMLLTGYDDDAQTFRILNSWGEGWGERGTMAISYGAFFAGLVEPEVYEIDEIDSEHLLELAAAWPSAVVPMPSPLPEPARIEPAPPPTPVPVPTPPAPLPPKPDPETTLVRIEALPAITDCGRLRHARHGGVLALQGFVQSRAVLSTMLAEAGLASDRVSIAEVEEQPWPQCEIRGDYVEARRGSQDGWRLELTPAPIRGAMPVGTEVGITLANPAKSPVFLYVYYIQALRDGNVVPLMQPVIGRGGRPLPSTFGPRIDVATPAPGVHRELRVTVPVGHEAIVFVAARQALFPQAISSGELNERQLLTALRGAVATAERSGDLLAVSAAFLETRQP